MLEVVRKQFSQKELEIHAFQEKLADQINLLKNEKEIFRQQNEFLVQESSSR